MAATKFSTILTVTNNSNFNELFKFRAKVNEESTELFVS